MKIRIAHKKSECIGCALCTEVAGDYFAMDENGEAVLRTITAKRGPFDYADGCVVDLERIKAAEEGCPVDIIHIQ